MLWDFDKQNSIHLLNTIDYYQYLTEDTFNL